MLLKNEGLDNAWSRHHAMHQELKEGVEALGLKFVVDEESRLPQLNALYFPEGIDEAKVRSQLLEEYNLEVGAGLGSLAGKAWRIGLMGSSSNDVNINRCLRAFEAVLR